MKLRNLLKTAFSVILLFCLALSFGLFTANADDLQTETAVFTDVDITQKLSIVRVQKTEDKNYLEFFVNAGEPVGAYVKGKNTNPSVYSGEGRRWVLNGSTADEVQEAGCDLLSLIVINGKTVREIITSESGKYGEFDLNDDAFKTYTPVMVNAEGLFTDGFHFMISKQYVKDVNGGKVDGFSLTFKSGIVWQTIFEHSLKTSSDVTFKYWKGAFATGERAENIKPTVDKDVSDGMKVEMTNKSINGCARVYFDFGAEYTDLLPIMRTDTVVKDGGFYVNDHATDYGVDVDFMEYLLINGRTARSIVEENAKTQKYVGKSHPMSWGGRFAPVTVQVVKGQVRVEVYEEYCSWQDLRVTFKNGFTWTVLGTETTNYVLKWTKDVTYGVKDGTFKKFDGSEKVNLDKNLSIIYGADDGDYKRFAVSFNDTFGDGVKDVTEAMKDVVTFNGKKVSELNAVSETAKVRVSFNNGKTGLEILIAKSYVSLEGVDEIGLNPFTVEFLSLDHSITEKVEFKRSGNAFKRICYVSFDGQETIKALKGEKLPSSVIPDTPEKTGTDDIEYLFKGWYYIYSDGREYSFEPENFTVISNMSLYSKFQAQNKKYTVTLLNEDGSLYATQEIPHGADIKLSATPTREHYQGVWVFQGDNAPTVMPKQNVTYKMQYVAKEYTITFYKNAVGNEVLAKVTYTVEDKDITVPDLAEKAGYKGSWSAYSLDGGDIEVRPVYSGGCSSKVSVAPTVGLITLICALVVVLKKCAYRK